MGKTDTRTIIAVSLWEFSEKLGLILRMNTIQIYFVTKWVPFSVWLAFMIVITETRIQVKLLPPSVVDMMRANNITDFMVNSISLVKQSFN